MNHIKDISIHNFKKFPKLQLEGLGQINLIVGDNNVGKTTLLEALLFDDDLVHFINALYSILATKQLKIISNDDEGYAKYLKLFFHKFSTENTFQIKYKLKKQTDYTTLSFEIIRNLSDIAEGDLKELENNKAQFRHRTLFENQDFYPDLAALYVNKKLKDIYPLRGNLVKKLRSHQVIPYIPFSKGYDTELVNYYSEYIQVDKIKRQNFIKSLENFIPNIEGIDVTTRFGNNPNIEIIENNSNTSSPLSTYGDEANKLFRILLQIAVAENNRLMIDEIDTGVHFSRFKKFWQIIIDASKFYNVQLFTTTHNPDGLIYFNEALEDKQNLAFRDEARIFTLRQLPDESIKVYKYGFKEFEFVINQGIEIRGGNHA